MNLTKTLILIATAHSATADPDVHTVQAGDTLSCLSGAYVADAYQWPAIAARNDIADPHNLAIGTPLSIPNLTGIDPATVDCRSILQGGRTAPTARPSAAPARSDAGNPAPTATPSAAPDTAPTVAKLAAQAPVPALPRFAAPAAVISAGANGSFAILTRSEPRAALGRTIGIDAKLLDQAIRP